MIRAASLAIELNLLRFSRFIQSQGIPHRISEESGEQVIWVEDQVQAEFVQELLENWSFDEAECGDRESQAYSLKYKGKILSNSLSVFAQSPVSISLIVLCILVAVVSSLGSQPQRVAYLFFPLLSTAGLADLLMSIASVGDLFRSFTPMLLHFGELHLVFNMVWLWYFGRQLEGTHPRWLFVCLILGCSFVGNVTQYLYSGYNNFGGMSGVIYGLVGYAWLIHNFMPRSNLLITSNVFVVFVIALIVMELVASSWIASAAHVGGLISGLVFGVMVVMVYRFVLKQTVINK
jgi:GlpG protein